LADGDWGRREPTLYAADYRDTLDLLKYIRFDKQIEISVQSPRKPIDGFRCNLFEAIWGSYRRQLLSMVRALIDISLLLGVNAKKAMEILGTREKFEFFLNALIGTLGDLSVIHFEAIEDDLRFLARLSNPLQRSIVAQSLSRWVRSQKGNELAITLNSWLKDSQQDWIDSLVQSALASQTVVDAAEKFRIRQTTEANMRLTILETTLFCLYREENIETFEEFYKIFEGLSNDPIDEVVDQLIIGLPALVEARFDQLIDRLERLMNNERIIEPISRSLSRVFHNPLYAQRVLDKLQEWFTKYANAPASSPSELNQREFVLMVVAQTYGSLKEGN
jgi:hypothetical protein